MGTLLHRCAKVCQLIEMLFAVVSGIIGGMGILDGVHMPQGEGVLVRLEIRLGFTRNMQKCSSYFIQKSQQQCHAATFYARLMLSWR